MSNILNKFFGETVMKTELNRVDAAVVPGAQIDVVEFRIRNFRLHGMLESLSRLLINILEVQSNDTNSVVVPSDVRDINAQFKIIEEDLAFGMEVNDAPIGAYQHAYVVLLIEQKEVQRIRNVKVKSVVRDLWMLGQIILGCDSAKTQNFIDKNDQVKIARALEVSRKSMDRWIGSGEDADNLGIYSPSFVTSGELVPDVDADFAQRLEPSKAIPKAMLDDVPDTPSSGKK
jgi:hypothetical protein